MSDSTKPADPQLATTTAKAPELLAAKEPVTVIDLGDKGFELRLRFSPNGHKLLKSLERRLGANGLEHVFRAAFALLDHRLVKQSEGYTFYLGKEGEASKEIEYDLRPAAPAQPAATAPSLETTLSLK